MESIFKINEELVAQINVCVKHFGVCIVHGCGNYYIDKKKSDDRKEYADPDQPFATYRVTYNKGDKVPQTVKDLDNDLHNGKKAELVVEKQAIAPSPVTSLPKVVESEKKGKEVKTNEKVQGV